MSDTKPKQKKRTGDEADTAIMCEIDTLLSDYEFTRYQFIKFMMDMDQDQTNLCQLEEANCNHYFNGRPVPLHHLLIISESLLALECKIPPEEENRLEAYRSGAKRIQEKVLDYISKSVRQPLFFRRVIRAMLRMMEDIEIENLFHSLYRFNVPRHVWDFWTCYCCLDYLAQEKIREVLSGYIILPEDNAKMLLKLHVWELEVNAPICVKYGKYNQKYYQQCEQILKGRKKEELTKEELVKIKEIRDGYINYLVGLLQTYPYITTGVMCFVERAASRIDMSDWAILSTYSLLYTALEVEEIRQIDETLLEFVEKDENRPYITKDAGQRKKLQPEIVKRCIGNFKESKI